MKEHPGWYDQIALTSEPPVSFLTVATDHAKRTVTDHKLPQYTTTRPAQLLVVASVSILLISSTRLRIPTSTPSFDEWFVFEALAVNPNVIASSSGSTLDQGMSPFRQRSKLLVLAID
ncbi:hypothetical protein KCU62_g10, partial [Aureobasidium sp. EXF-3399]